MCCTHSWLGVAQGEPGRSVDAVVDREGVAAGASAKDTPHDTFSPREDASGTLPQLPYRITGPGLAGCGRLL